MIGKAARNVTEAEALDIVAGYCTGNDFSARDLQMELPVGNGWLAKPDGFAPIGPYFVSADFIRQSGRNEHHHPRQRRITPVIKHLRLHF